MQSIQQNKTVVMIYSYSLCSSYPAEISDSNLKNIVRMRNLYDVEIGLSDHTLGNTASTVAVALGATAIEKHFTFSRNEKGLDSKFSIEPKELKQLVKFTREAWSSLGKEGFSRSSNEIKNKEFRRSIYFVKDLKAGHIILRNDIKSIWNS